MKWIRRRYQELSEAIPDTPFVHLWARFGKIKHIFPIDKPKAKVTETELQSVDSHRWIEISDDYIYSFEMKIRDTGINELIVERKQEDGTWPRAKGDDWRKNLQIGDFVDMRDDYDYKWYECLVRFVYPENSEKFGKCVIHYVGWNVKWDEEIDIEDKERLAQRHTHSKGPHRPIN